MYKRQLKGMAVYSDDLPDGVDVVFNTNKKQGTPTGDVLKKITNDPENPFGSLIKIYIGRFRAVRSRRTEKIFAFNHDFLLSNIHKLGQMCIRDSCSGVLRTPHFMPNTP